MAYRAYTDGIFFGVQDTSAEPNGEDVFSTFGDAKKAVLAELRVSRQDYTIAIRLARRMKLADVEEEGDE